MGYKIIKKVKVHSQLPSSSVYLLDGMGVVLNLESKEEAKKLVDLLNVNADNNTEYSVAKNKQYG